MRIDEDTLLRVRALRGRGLSRMLAVQLWSAGDESLLSDLERATDDQLRELNRLEITRRQVREVDP